MSYTQFLVSMLSLCAAASLLATDAHAEAIKWDYKSRPVVVTENRPSGSPLLGVQAASAFDGWGAQGSSPAAVHAWIQGGLPTDQSPMICEIDYGSPVAVSAFVHYFHTPWCRDLRFMSPGPSAFKRVRISSKVEGGDWVEAALLDNLPAQCPQALPVVHTKPARYWRIEVLELAPGAEALCTYELETYTDGLPVIKPEAISQPDLMSQFVKRVRKVKPSFGDVSGEISLGQDKQTFDFRLGSVKSAGGKLALLAAGKPCAFVADGDNKWRSVSGDDFILKSKRTPAGLLLEISFNAKRGDPVAYRRITMHTSVANPKLFYVPAYVWSRTPVDATVPGSGAQTRMSGLGAAQGMVCTVPGTDHCTIGFAGGQASTELLVGSKPVSVLLTFVPGDWWDAYSFVTHGIYGFDVQQQTVPVSEIQYGVSRYMVTADVWDPVNGTVKLWPADDSHSGMFGSWNFNLYGPPYSIPAYWARYVMNGDKLALDRCRGIANWLCKSGIRVKEGPSKGAFFTLQMFGLGEKPTLEKQGQSWPGAILTSQSTGAALWSLIYYRKVTGDASPEIDGAVKDAAEWLLKSQTPDGGWPYAHDLQAKPVAGASSSGSIWNIWSLWRLGKQIGDSRYLAAAERATKWFADTFVNEHHYHGYWEDVGAGSREGYEAAIAAVAFSEMDRKDLAVETARDAVQWVFTRQVEQREPSNSAGLVAEQTGWPPAYYCNPMMALAAHSAWEITGDDSWRAFAMIPKAMGWWYRPESGGMMWIVDSTTPAPVVGPRLESLWNDWCVAQPGSLSLRWLIREVVRRSGGQAKLDEESLTGTLLGRDVKAWAPPGGLHPILPMHGQVNWLGFRGDGSILVALMNDGATASVKCALDSEDVGGAAIWPKAVYQLHGGSVRKLKWDGISPVRVARDGLTILEWGVKP